jgi:hypothetical protein
MVPAATTQRSRSPAPTSRKKNDKATPVPKVILLPALTSFLSKSRAMACASFTISMATKHTIAFSCVPGRKLKRCRTLTSSVTNLANATATAMHFPAKAGLIFVMDEFMNNRYLVDTGTTLSIVPCTSNAGSAGPLLKGAEGKPIPSWGFISKTVQFQGKLFTAKFLKAAVAGPNLGIDFLRKFRITVAPETSQVLFACTAMAPAAAKSFLPTVLQAAEPFVFVPSAATPIAMQQIHDSVPEEMKHLLQKFPSILRTGDVMPTPTHGVKHHIHTGSHPPVFSKSCRLHSEKLEIAKAEFKHLESASIVCRSKGDPWASPLHMVPKKDGSWRPCFDYHHLNLVTNPDKYLLPNMQDLLNGLHGCNVFLKIDLVKCYYLLSQSQTPQKTACLSICSRRLGCLTLQKRRTHEWPRRDVCRHG